MAKIAKQLGVDVPRTGRVEPAHNSGAGCGEPSWGGGYTDDGMLAALQARHTEQAEAQAAEHERISTGHRNAMGEGQREAEEKRTAALAAKAQRKLKALITVALTAEPAFAKALFVEALIVEVQAANAEALQSLDGDW